MCATLSVPVNDALENRSKKFYRPCFASGLKLHSDPLVRTACREMDPSP